MLSSVFRCGGAVRSAVLHSSRATSHTCAIRQYSSPSSDYGKKHICRGIGRSTDLVLTRGEGNWVYDENNEKYLDFTSGIGVVNTGHCHPKVVKAVQEQAARISHGQVNIAFHKPMLELIEKLIPIMPCSSLDTFFFWNSGAEAVEGAVKLARQYTKKQNIIVFQGSYHGRTFGTMSLTTSKTIYKQGFGPMMPGVVVAPFPYRSQLPENIGTDEEMKDYCLESFRQLLKQQSHPEDTAACLIEPVLGEGGYVVPPEGFLSELKQICKENNILLICDEVQSGFGRTGKYFAVEHFGVSPDVLVCAKGLASGYPLSMVVSRREIFDAQPPGSMGGTYAGNAVSCAAAKATIEIFEEEKLVENSRIRGEQFTKRLLAMQKSGLPIKEVRGRGLMIATEFGDNCPYNKVIQSCYEQKMLVLAASIFNTLRYIPALTVSEKELELGMDILETAIKSSVQQ